VEDPTERALRLLAMSAKELPDDPEVQYHYGLALRESGDRSAARDALERALAIDDRFAGAEQAKAALAELR
jgi:cellulose synthase operon protein C